MKAVHYIILFSVVALVYLLVFAKCPQPKGEQNDNKNELIARLKTEAMPVVRFSLAST